MLDLETIRQKIKQFKVRNGVLDAAEEHVVAAIHLMNASRIDLSAAQDQTSHGSNDHGIDAWSYDRNLVTLSVFQSKFSGARTTVLKGLEDLPRAADWIAEVLETGTVEGNRSNPCIHNLVKCLAENKDLIRYAHLVLISPFNDNAILDSAEYAECERALTQSRLNKLLSARGGHLALRAEPYKLDGEVLPAEATTYYVRGFNEAAEKPVSMSDRTKLRVVYVYLASLVDLYRRRGNHIFEKNVRLYLNTKEARDRLEHPMEDTFDKICAGELSPNIFPFYHVGVTLTADGLVDDGKGVFSLLTPFIINGCQTVNIADRYLKRLEKEKAAPMLDRFKVIPVVAKVVIGATSEQIREITNCNNRQNPIEGWQLFSNDPIHIEIEMALADIKVFYERQKGKFDAEMKNASAAARFDNTNNTRITVFDLGQIICLSRKQLQLSAKPSDVFASKQVHDGVFDWGVQERTRDMIWAFNSYKAVKSALNRYLLSPSHDNDQTHAIFRKPIVRQVMHYLALMYLYQRCSHRAGDFAIRLNKKAPHTLVEEAESFYRRVIAKTKAWYLKESENLGVEASFKKLEGLLQTLAHDTGLDTDGPMPFTEKSHDWSELLPPDMIGAET